MPPPFEWQAHSEAENRQIRDRQRSRARVMALLLVAFVVLMFAITFVKINAGLQ